jgi:hypothetical protein
MNERLGFAHSLTFWRIAAILGAAVAVGVTVPFALHSMRIWQNTRAVTVSFVSGLMEREDCVNKANELRGERALRGIAETGHAIRWSNERKICVMAMTYARQSGTGNVERVADIIDVTFSRKLFSFATDGDIDPKQLLRFDHDLDLPTYPLSGSAGESSDSEYALSAGCPGGQNACVASVVHE